MATRANLARDAAPTENPLLLASFDRSLPIDLIERAKNYRTALAAELKPSSILAEILVSHLAHHAAAMNYGAHAEAAAIRSASSDSAALRLFASAGPSDAPLLAAELPSPR